MQICFFVYDLDANSCPHESRWSGTQRPKGALLFLPCAQSFCDREG